MNFIFLYAFISFEAILFVAELVASQLTHSLIILTDAYHTGYNIFSIILLIISFKISTQTSVKNTFGWARIEVLGMLINMTFLLALTFSLIVEGIQQLVHSSHEITEPTNYYLLLVFGVCSLILNFIYFNVVSDEIMSHTKQRSDSLGIEEKILFTDIDDTLPSTSSQTDTNVVVINKLKVEETRVIEDRTHQQNVFFGILRDLMGSFLMISCAVCIMFTVNTIARIIDPIFGMVSALIFCATLYPNIKATGFILLQTVPENINVSQLTVDIKKEFPIILNIHDLHVWGLTSSKIIATCHIILPELSSEIFDEFFQCLNQFFKRQGIILATVQPEFIQQDQHLCEFPCLMRCSKFSKTNCDSYTCCKDEKSDCTHRSKSKDLVNQVDSQQFQEVLTNISK